jgi:hypothetical protein
MNKATRVKSLSKEQWRAIRAMVEEEGMTLMGAAAKSGVPYATVNWHSRMECWNPPGGKKIGRPRDTGILEAQARRIEAEVARQDALMKAEAAVVKAEDLEVLCRKSLVADSARLKVAISRRVTDIVARLEARKYRCVARPRR